MTYDGNNAAGFQQTAQVLQELLGEEVDWFGAAGEDVVDNVVEAGIVLLGSF